MELRRIFVQGIAFRSSFMAWVPPRGSRDNGTGSARHLQSLGRGWSFFTQVVSLRDSAAPEYCLLCEWVFGLPLGFRAQSRRPLWLRE